MRKIKFRGKDIERREWICGSLSYRHIEPPEPGISMERIAAYILEHEFDACEVEVDPDTIGQFTGILDSTGKEIYEGDILTGNVIVSWNYLTAGYDISIDSLLKGVKVIGNIHDNPELINR